jgi:hypothetical protein
MSKFSTVTTAALLAFGVAGTALAQAPAPAGAATDPHQHEAPGGATQPGSPPGPAAGMMGGDMGRMMQQMMQRRMTAASMQPFRRIEGQLAFFRAELRITDAQLPQWNALAEAVRANAERIRQATQQAMGTTAGPGTALQQIERRIALLFAHLEAMRAVSTAAATLYAALSEEQRRTADELMAEHLLGMRMP